MADPIIGKISVGDGATFTPSVTDGVISWTNNKSLPNPDPYDVAAKVLAEGENELRTLVTNAQAAAGNAADSATNAHNSELAAAASETAAKASETAAKASETAARTQAGNAADSATNAHNSELAAAASEGNAATSADEAEAAAEEAQELISKAGYLPLSGGTLTGFVNGVTPPNGDNSAKIATTAFVNAKAGNYLPLSGGTVTGGLTVKGTITGNLAGNAASANTIKDFEQATYNAFRNVWFSDSSNNAKPVFYEGIQYNPSTNVLKTGTFQGKLNGNADTATKATADGNGNNIQTTYAKKTDVANISKGLTQAETRISALENGAYIVAANLVQNGYVKFSNGLIIQWGTNQPSPITFPVSFASKCLTVVPQLQAPGDSANMSKNRVCVTNLTARGFAIENPQSKYNYIAIGV